jgi:hypothetical protein
MLHRQRHVPAPVHSLAGHLDAIVAAGEALLAPDGMRLDPHRRLRLEFTAIAHALQLRHDLQEIVVEDRAVAGQIRLFLAATDCLEDAASVRVSPRTGAPAHDLIGGRIPIATLIALAAAMREVLGVCYGVPDGASAAQAPPSPIPETLVWATSPDVA